MAPRFTVELSQNAEDDVLAIGHYITQHADLATALKIMDGLDACWSKLSRFPGRGNVPKELQSVGRRDLRELHYKPYRIFYRVEGRRVKILAVADGRRNIQEFLQQRLPRNA